MENKLKKGEIMSVHNINISVIEFKNGAFFFLVATDDELKIRELRRYLSHIIEDMNEEEIEKREIEELEKMYGRKNGK